MLLKVMEVAETLHVSFLGHNFLTQWGGYIKWAKITGKYEAERAKVAASFNLRKGAMVAATFRLRLPDHNQGVKSCAYQLPGDQEILIRFTNEGG